MKQKTEARFWMILNSFFALAALALTLLMQGPWYAASLGWLVTIYFLWHGHRNYKWLRAISRDEELSEELRLQRQGQDPISAVRSEIEEGEGI